METHNNESEISHYTIINHYKAYRCDLFESHEQDTCKTSFAILIQKKMNRKFYKPDKNDEAPCTSYVHIDSIPCYN